MPVNVEIKARVSNPVRRQTLAAALSHDPGTLLQQEDTFFHTPQGRLKLRTLTPTHGEIIYYERADATGPKLSRYEIAYTSTPEALTATLAAAWGVRGVVRKQRWLYLLGQTRVHVDTVEGLGTFVELEWVMQPGQTHAEGVRAVAELMQRLEITEAELTAEAYIDLLSAAEGASRQEGAC
jgi:predicted adenylyl cyclase CyaB